MKSIRNFAGAQVGCDYSDGVRVVIRWNLGRGDQKRIRGLGDALGGFSRISCDAGHATAEIIYSDDCDERIVELIELLIALRYSHPRMVQLPLQIEPAEQRELAEVMGG